MAWSEEKKKKHGVIIKDFVKGKSRNIFGTIVGLCEKKNTNNVGKQHNNLDNQSILLLIYIYFKASEIWNRPIGNVLE